jgi:signal transduction histidine kinase
VAGLYDRLVRRLAAWVNALPPRMQDLALALALAAYNVVSLIPEAGQLSLRYAAFALVVLQTLPLTLRRRWPVGVWVAVSIPRDVYDQLGISFAPLPLALMIAYYTVMDRSSTRVRWVVSLVTLVGSARAATFPGHGAYSFFVSVLEFAAAGMAGIISRTRRAYLREAEARAEQAQTERDRQVALAAAQERTRIARELHDVVAHHVSLIAVQSDAAATLLPGQPAQAEKHVEIIGQTAREALAELRRLLGVLRGPASAGRQPPDTAPVPSVSQLGKVLDQVREAGISVDLRVEGSPARLAPGVDLAAYRIVQEALTNTVRHSGAGEAAVTVRYEPGFVTVSVTDTGHGPVPLTAGQQADPAAAAVRNGPSGSNGSKARPTGPGGFGLAGIAERVASCGGSLTVGPGQAGGFAVTARLPTP